MHGSDNNTGSVDSPWKTLQEVFRTGKISSRQIKPDYLPWPESDRHKLTTNQVLSAKNESGPVRGGDVLVLMSGEHGAVDTVGYYNEGG